MTHLLAQTACAARSGMARCVHRGADLTADLGTIIADSITGAFSSKDNASLPHIDSE